MRLVLGNSWALAFDEGKGYKCTETSLILENNSILVDPEEINQFAPLLIEKSGEIVSKLCLDTLLNLF